MIHINGTHRVSFGISFRLFYTSGRARMPAVSRFRRAKRSHYLSRAVLKESILSAENTATFLSADECSLYLPRIPLNSKECVLIVFSLEISAAINHLQPMSVRTLRAWPLPCRVICRSSKIDADGVKQDMTMDREAVWNGAS